MKFKYIANSINFYKSIALTTPNTVSFVKWIHTDVSCTLRTILMYSTLHWQEYCCKLRLGVAPETCIIPINLQYYKHLYNLTYPK